MGRHPVDFLQLCIKRQKREDIAQMERMSAQLHQQQPQREIVHRGWLQQKKYRNGTLLRKKKVFYENELFVVLSVHNGTNGCIPRLEWFAEPSAILERRPLKFQDLTECQYVNVAIGDERCLAIGFADGSAPILELLAPSIEERVHWVDILRATLRRLNLLSNGNAEGQRADIDTDNEPFPWPRPTNEYVVLAGTCNNDSKPSTSSPPPQAPPLTISRTNATPNGGSEEVMVAQPPQGSPLSPISSPLHQVQADNNSAKKSQDVERRRSNWTENSPDESVPLVRQHSEQQMQSQLSNGANEQRIGDRTRASDNENDEHCPSPSSLISLTDKRAQDDDANGALHSLVPPPLPPRMPRQNNAAAQCSTTTGSSEAFPADLPPLPKSPIPLLPSPNLSHYELLTAPSSPPLRTLYDHLPPCNRQSQCSDAIGSSAEVPPDVQPRPTAHYDVLCAPSSEYDVLSVPSSPPAMFLPPYSTTTTSERIFRDALSRSRRLFFSFTLLTEHIAFVELFDKVWVAGWTSAVDLHLRENAFTLNFGDEVERIDGSEVRNLRALTEVYQRIMPGAQIPLFVRANPTMMVFTLVKPENPRPNLGIKFSRTTKFLLRQPFDCLSIDSIVSKSPAQKANLPATVPAYLHQPIIHSSTKLHQSKPFHASSPSSPNLLPSGGSDRAVITHLDGVPLDPFGPKDQFFRRLDTVLVGNSFNVTLHSADFCARLARQMKNQLGNKWRRFVHGE